MLQCVLCNAGEGVALVVSEYVAIQCNTIQCDICIAMQQRERCDSVGSESGRCQQTPHTQLEPHGLQVSA